MRNATDRDKRGRRGGQAGVAMLEFVLMLPFVWIVLVLILDFGQGFLEQQRTMVAVREVAIRNAQGVGGDVAGDVLADTFGRRGMTATFAASDGGTCPRQPSMDEGQLDSVLSMDLGWLGSAASGALGNLSKTTVYEVTAQGGPIAGRLLEPRAYQACFAIDEGTWTKDQLHGYGDIIANVVKGAVKALGSKFF